MYSNVCFADEVSTTVEISGCKKVVKVKNFLKKSEVGFVDITESGDK